MPLDFNEIRQLLATIAQTDITEVTLKSDDFELTVRKAASVSNSALQTGSVGLGAVGSGLTSHPPSAPSVVPPQAAMDTEQSRVFDNHPVAGGVPSSATVSPVMEQRLVDIPSPMVGTFYRASAPGEAPFVEVGDRVRSGQTVCIIEAMKLMNEIEAEVSGQVMEVLLQNGEPVEYGQPLMRINPD